MQIRMQQVPMNFNSPLNYLLIRWSQKLYSQYRVTDLQITCSPGLQRVNRVYRNDH